MYENCSMESLAFICRNRSTNQLYTRTERLGCFHKKVELKVRKVFSVKLSFQMEIVIPA